MNLSGNESNFMVILRPKDFVQSKFLARRVVERELLPAWLRLSGENIVQLLHHLDVGNSDQEVAARAGARPSAPAGALNVLFNETAPRELVEQFQYLDTDKLVPFDKLTPETAMYWRVLTKYLRDEGAEDCLELLLPELTPFCQYVRHYVLEMEKEDEDLNWEFVARELVAITGVFDLADEVGRQHLVSLVKALLTSSRTPASFIPALVEVFTRVEKDPQSRVNQVAEVISELKDPMQSSTQKGQASISAGSDAFFDAAETLSPSPKKNAAAVQVSYYAISRYFSTGLKTEFVHAHHQLMLIPLVLGTLAYFVNC